MKHKLNFILTGVIVLSALTVLVTAAPSNTPQATGSGSGQSDMCAKVSSGVDNMTERYQQNMNSYTNRYKNMYDSLTALQTRLQQKGYDTESLEEDLTSLNGYLEDLAQTQNQCMMSFQEMKSYACTEDGIGSQYKNSTDEAKGCLANYRTQAQSMYQLLKGEVKQDLIDIKGQTPTTTED